MTEQRGFDVRNVDLNLIYPLHALLTECNVTRAARRLSVGQPAMSASLARLRRLIGDPLLVKEGRQMALTPVGQSLVTPVGELLAATSSLLGGSASFDPATEHRVFTVVASDYMTLVVLRPLLTELCTIAPNVRINIKSLWPGFIEFLRAGHCDLLLWPPDVPVDDLLAFPRANLFTEDYVAVVDRENARVGTTITESELSSMPYVQVVGPFSATVEARFNAVGTPRSVVAASETFFGAAQLVAGTPMVAVVQRRLFDLLGSAIGLRAVELDFEMPTFTEAMYWNPRFSADPAHLWLRDVVRRLTEDL